MAVALHVFALALYFLAQKSYSSLLTEELRSIKLIYSVSAWDCASTCLRAESFFIEGHYTNRIFGFTEETMAA